MATQKTKQELTGKQVRFLKSLGHHLNPLAMVGKEGISKQVVQSVTEVLHAHELIKVKIQKSCELDRQEVAIGLSAATGAAVVQIIGNIVLLYRENPDLKADKKITLP